MHVEDTVIEELEQLHLQRYLYMPKKRLVRLRHGPKIT